MADRTPIIEAKKALYRAMLELKPDEVTEKDADMMMTLMHDPEIQRVFEKRMRS